MCVRMMAAVLFLAVAASTSPLAAQTGASAPGTKPKKPSPAAAKKKKPLRKIVLSGPCADYHKERVKLEAAGVRATLGKDPSVVASSLPAEELEKIRRLIELDEKMMFECRVIRRRVVIKKTAAAQIIDPSLIPDLPARRPAPPVQPGAKIESPVPLPVRRVR